MNAKLLIEELVGNTYGRLTIIAETDRHQEPNGKKQRVMLCKCTCGNIHKVQLKELRKGSTISCGCITKEKTIDLENIKFFNNWEFIEKISNKKARIKCVCGFEKTTWISYLIKNKSKSCGCTFRTKKETKISLPLPVDTVDEKWKYCLNNKYIISSKGGFCSSRYKKVKYPDFCLTKIGKTKIFFKDLFYETFIESFDKTIYKVVKIDDSLPLTVSNVFLARIAGNSIWVSKLRSNMAGHKMGISTILKKHIIEQYKKQKGKSSFLKLPLDTSMKNSLLAISIDRIDNSKGYSPDNFTLVTRFENMGRGGNSFEEMQNFCKDYLQSSTQT